MHERSLATRPSVRRAWLLWPAMLVLASAVMLPARGRLDKAHVALAFLLVVLGASADAGRALGIAIAGAAFLGFDLLFLKPYGTLEITDPLDWFVLAAFLITGIVAAQLVERLRRQVLIADRRADEIDRLASLGAETLNAARAEDALAGIAAVIGAAMGTDRCEIALRGDDGSLRATRGNAPAGPDDRQASLLTYIIAGGEAAAERDDGTVTLMGESLATSITDDGHSHPLRDLRALGIPLRVRERIVGAIWLSHATIFSLSDDQRRVLAALSYYAALGAERVMLTRAADETEGLRRADRLKDALLASVSHDLRTPLTAIKAIASEVWGGGDPRRAQVIEEEADRLNALVNDLLELSQLNAGEPRVMAGVNTADDVIGASVERVEAAHRGARIDVRVANDDGLLVGRFDFAMTMRALTNLLENAFKYSPSTAGVYVRAMSSDGALRIDVEDDGPGISDEDIARIFEPFYRGRSIPDGVRGHGLGLAIARQLALAQQGTLTYERRAAGGSRFTLRLPAARPREDGSIVDAILVKDL